MAVKKLSEIALAGAPPALTDTVIGVGAETTDLQYTIAQLRSSIVALTVGTTEISGGTTGRVLYDNAGVLGEYTNAQLTALINPVTALLSGAIPAFPNNTTTFFRGDGTYAALPSSFSGLANPTASVGLSAVNGTATTAMRSDAAPALDQTAAYAFSGLGATTISQQGASASALTLTGGTVTTSQPLINATQTWNAGAVSFIGYKLNITNTASASGSRLFDFQVGGSSKISGDFTGTIYVPDQGGIASSSRLLLQAGASYYQVTQFAITPAANNQTVGAATNPFNSFFVGATSGTVAILTGPATATLQLGAADVSSGAVAQTVTFQSNTGASTTGPLALIKGAGGGSGAGSIGGELRLQGGLSSAAAGTGGAITLYTAPSGAGATAALALTIGTNKAATFSGGIVHAVAQTLSISSGTNQRAGNATLVGGTVTVSNTTVTANTIVSLTRKTSGGTIGTAITYTVSAATSFTITSDNILDTSTFSYVLIEVP